MGFFWLLVCFVVVFCCFFVYVCGLCWFFFFHFVYIFVVVGVVLLVWLVGFFFSYSAGLEPGTCCGPLRIFCLFDGGFLFVYFNVLCPSDRKYIVLLFSHRITL